MSVITVNQETFDIPPPQTLEAEVSRAEGTFTVMLIIDGEIIKEQHWQPLVHELDETHIGKTVEGVVEDRAGGTHRKTVQVI